LEVIDFTNYDLIAPIFGRKWFEGLYLPYINLIRDRFELIAGSTRKVILDFTPLSDLRVEGFGDDYISWYDLIDNFTKHNRYSHGEKCWVEKKYSKLYKYKILTAVSFGAAKAVEELSKKSPYVVHNGILECSFIRQSVIDKYDFGFMGFITNKFDVEFLYELKRKFPLSRIAVYGDAYDHAVLKDIKKCADYFGAYHINDVDNILNSFKVGLIPYKNNLSHDESPIKIYNYLNARLPVISTIPYEINIKGVSYLRQSCNICDDELLVISQYLQGKYEFDDAEYNEVMSRAKWSVKLAELLEMVEFK
jgi:hypothetical protein